MTTIEEATNVCPLCNGAGWYKYEVSFDHPEFGKPHRCECRANELPYADRVALERLMAQIGDKYRDATFAKFNVKRRYIPFTYNDASIPEEYQFELSQAAYTACRAMAQNPERWLYLYGPPGSGKTHLAISTLLDCARSRKIYGWYANVPMLLDRQRPGVIDDAQRVSEWAAMITSPLLVIDDMADEYIRSPWSIERMYMLINERYNSATPTIITSNIHPRELPDQRMVSRIMGESRILYMPLSDYRWRIKK